MKKILVITILLILSATAVFSQSINKIKVSAETTLETDVVKLGSIAEISGDVEKIERLKSISLGYAPNIGMIREVNPAQIKLALKAAGFSESDVVLETPDKILIRRAGQTISLNEIRETVEKQLLEKFANEKISAQIKRLDAPQNIQIPKGAFEIIPSFSGVQNYFQPFSLPLEIRVDGKVFRRVSANVEIEAFTDILVAAKDLSANQKISESDVRFEKRRINKPLTNYLRETEKLRGLLTLKNIWGGAEITLDSVVSGVVIKSGDRVRVEAQSEKLKIVVSGEARSSGRIGDRISVKNLQSNAILQAVVVDEGLVQITF